MLVKTTKEGHMSMNDTNVSSERQNIIPESENQYTPAKENVKSPWTKRTNFPVRWKSAAVGEPADKQVKNNPETITIKIKIERNR